MFWNEKILVLSPEEIFPPLTISKLQNAQLFSTGYNKPHMYSWVFHQNKATLGLLLKLPYKVRSPSHKFWIKTNVFISTCSVSFHQLSSELQVLLPLSYLSYNHGHQITVAELQQYIYIYMTTMKWPNPIGFRITNGCPIKSTRKGSNQNKHCQRERENKEFTS